MGCNSKNANFFESSFDRWLHQHSGKSIEGPNTSTGSAGSRRKPTYSSHGTGDTTFRNNEADPLPKNLRYGDTKPNVDAFGEVLHGDEVSAFTCI